MELSPHSLTPRNGCRGIRGLVGVAKLSPACPSSALPPRRLSPGAAPKCISGRTSYLRVRLAFHLYPQVIPAVCNRHGFGPPRACSARFTLPMGSSPGFGSGRRDSRPVRTRVRSGSACPLASPRHAYPLVGSFYKRHAVTHHQRGGLRPAGGTWFQALFHSPQPGCFSPFPHGTGPLSVASGI